MSHGPAQEVVEALERFNNLYALYEYGKGPFRRYPIETCEFCCKVHILRFDIDRDERPWIDIDETEEVDGMPITPLKTFGCKECVKHCSSCHEFYHERPEDHYDCVLKEDDPDYENDDGQQPTGCKWCDGIGLLGSKMKKASNKK